MVPLRYYVATVGEFVVHCVQCMVICANILLGDLVDEYCFCSNWFSMDMFVFSRNCSVK